MNSSNLFQNPLPHWLEPRHKHSVLVKQLQERDRRRMLRHFLSLEDGDRLLRFGTVLPDDQVAAYVNRIDFSRDTVYGVYNRVFQLVAVGHLAFALRHTMPENHAVTSKDRVAEFGVSVARSVRGRGFGSRLFERAAIHCRNNDVDTLYMHCLASNQTMMHIAKKAGMEILRDHGEADAYLRLLPPNPASMLQEAVDEQVASIDYTIKANIRAAMKWLECLPGRKGR